MSSDEEEVLLLLAVAEDEDKKKMWVHDINKDMLTFGEYHTLMPQLRKDDKRFYIYFRMTQECFDELLFCISDVIEKEDTNYREAISAEEWLAITLRFLATGDSFKTIGHSFRVGFSTVSMIVKEVCNAIIQQLQPVHLAEPLEETWKESATGFFERWQFPNCVGSIDGKHLAIKCPSKSSSTYFCYKNMFSIVLLSIVDPDYKFICVDVGGYGKNSDGGIFEESAMGKRLYANELNVPLDKPLPRQSLSTPHCLIGDEAFALKPNVMKPYSQRKARQDRRKRRFNYRLSRARGIVENTFGILAQKWRLYNRPLEVKVEFAKVIVMTTSVLHNFLRVKNSDATYFTCLEEDCEGPTGGAFSRLSPNFKKSSRYAMIVRERFVDFFNA